MEQIKISEKITKKLQKQISFILTVPIVNIEQTDTLAKQRKHKAPDINQTNSKSNNIVL